MSGAGARRPRWAAFAGLVIAVVVADQLTKAWLVSFLAPGEATSVVGNAIRLVNSHNAGGLFGILQGQAAPFAILSLAVMGLIVWYHARSGRNTYLTVTLGLLLGGAIGNAVDRVRLGYVVDFVDAGIGTVRWYTFNVADASISLAILLLLVAAVRPSLAEPDPAPVAGPPSGSAPARDDG
jgi:signal peptidase II